MKRWIVRIVGLLVTVIVVGAVAIYAISQRRLSKVYTYEVADAPPAAPMDTAMFARGRHLATAIGKCTACHGDDLGGQVFMDNGAMGRIAAPNLTSGGGTTRTAEDLERAIRHGIGMDGRALMFMPAEAFAHLSRADMRALIGYLQSLPPVARTMPPRSVGPISRMLVATGKMPLPVALVAHDAMPPETVVPSTSVEYGRYLANVGGCTGCHGPSLSGGIENGPPGTPPSSNLTPGGRTWTLPDFTRALREGVRPGGTPIDTFMPWRLTRLMTDQEIEAVWMYVRSVPAKAIGED